MQCFLASMIEQAYYVDMTNDSQFFRQLRFNWWKEAFLAALSGAAHGCSDDGRRITFGGPLEEQRDPHDMVVKAAVAAVIKAATTANCAGAQISEAYEYYVVKGLIGPGPE
jgi:hypothetical protein